MVLTIRKIRKFRGGIAERVVDMILIGIYFNLEAPSLIQKKRYLIESSVEEDLEKLNYHRIKRACSFLKRKGLIDFVKEKEILPIITKAGELKLRKIIPFYDEKRVWDGQIYLVSYDFPKDKNKERDYFRKFLRDIGCGMLQQSNWLTPYNPTNLIKKFIEKHELSGDLILISSIGKNGMIGTKTLKELMEKVFLLSHLNLRYREFVYKAKSGKEKRGELIYLFLSILNEDPQIPFSFLPDDWLGEEAYVLFKKLRLM